MPLELRVPVERSSPPKDLEVRPKALKAWMEFLPLAQPLEAARILLAHATGVNRAKVETEERIHILEVYRPIADVLFEELDHMYSRAPQPLPARARDALAAARGLHTEIAHGYKIAILEKTGKRIAFGLKKQLPPLILRAMQHLAANMRASYKAYAALPAGLWKELHQLYVYAGAEGMASEAVEGAGHGTIAELYCETLLVALTDPYRLMPGELDKVVEQIRTLRAPVTLGQQRPETRPGAHFLVPCDLDRPPKPALSANDETGGPNWRLLDANAIVDKLRTRVAALDSGNVSATMSRMVGPETHALMTRLAVLWGDPPKRAFRRDAAEGSVAICSGVKNIAHFVAHDAVGEDGAEAEAEALRRGITMPLRALPQDETGHPIPIYEWAVINHSEGGLKVRRGDPMTQSISVGEVVGIRGAGKRSWTIGVARWITVGEDGAMEFGVQLFATAACAVWVKTRNSSDPQAKLGVLLVDGEELDGESLLTPVNTYAELREFELQGEEYRSRMRATDLIEKTARFELFHVSAS